MGSAKKMKYCGSCGSPVETRVPEGDTMPRQVCPACNTIHYSNPKIIVGALPVWKKSNILLCQRAIEPRRGLWTLPSGFMENGEEAQQGAKREVSEEANADVKINYLHTLYNIPHISQVYLLFQADLLHLDFSPGLESSDVRLCSIDEIPWRQLAFSAIKYCLRRFREDLQVNLEGLTHYGTYPRK